MLKFLLIPLLTLLPLTAATADTGLPNPQVVIKTSNGDINLRLYADKSPETAKGVKGGQVEVIWLIELIKLIG